MHEWWCVFVFPKLGHHTVVSKQVYNLVDLFLKHISKSSRFKPSSLLSHHTEKGYFNLKKKWVMKFSVEHVLHKWSFMKCFFILTYSRLLILIMKRYTRKEVLWHKPLHWAWNDEQRTEERLLVIRVLWDDYVCLGGNLKDRFAIDKVIKIVHKYVRSMAIDTFEDIIDHSLE